MCLAIPGRVVEWTDIDPLFASARVEFGGVSRKISMQCVPDAEIDDFVLVHAGIAISKIDSDEAEKILNALEELDLADEEDVGEIEQAENNG